MPFRVKYPMRYLSLLVITFLVFTASAQETSTWQKFRQSPFEFYFDMGWVVGPSMPGARLDYIISVDYTPGLRYTLKLSDRLAGSLELSYHNVHYHLHMEAAKRLPDATLHDRERFYIHVINLAPVFRYQLHAEKDWSAELGFNFDWNFRKSHMIKNPDANGDPVKTFDRSITYFEPINFDLLARLRKGQWSAHYIYRITDLIKQESGLPGLPPTIVGIGLNI